MKRRVRQSWLAIAVAVSASALGCPTAPDPPPAASGDTTGVPDTATFLHEAHEKALDELVPKAQTLFALDDPVAAAALGRGPLRPPPVGAREGAALRTALDDAWSAAEEIKPDHLDPERAAVLRAIRFGLNRVRDRLLRHDPLRTDPGAYAFALAPFLAAVQRQVTDGNAAQAAAALKELPRAIDEAARQLGASAPATAEAAARRWTALGKRLRALPSLGPKRPGDTSGLIAATAAAADAADRFSQYAAKVRAALPNAPAQSYDRLLPPAGGKADAVRRLPDRLGATVLRRRLEVEEGIATPVTRLHKQLGGVIGRLHAMADKYPAAAAGPPVQCAARWASVTAWAGKNGPVPTASRSPCDALERGPSAKDPIARDRAMVRRGVIAPAHDARRAEELAALALLSGAMSEPSHARTMAIAVLVAIDARAALRREIAEASEAACLAAVALWVHGEMGTDAVLTEQLRALCPSRPVSGWIDAAIAEPREALRGLGLIYIGIGPADLAALQRYHWAPLGIIPTLAVPSGPLPPVAPPKVIVEPLTPTDGG